MEDLTGEWSPLAAAGCIAQAAARGKLAAAAAMADWMLGVGHAKSLAQELGQEVYNWLGADVRRLMSAILSGSSAAVGAALNSQLTVPFLHGTAASTCNWISWDMLHGMVRTGAVDGSATLPQVLCLAENHLIGPWLTDALSLAAAQQYPVPALKPVVQALLTYAPRCHATLTGGLLPLAAVPAWADELAFAVERLGCAPGAFLARAATSWNTSTLNRLLQCTTRRDLHELLEQVAASPASSAVPAQPKAAKVAALLGAAVLCKCQALPAAHARWLIRNASGDAMGRTLSRVLSLVLHLVPGPLRPAGPQGQEQGQAASGGGAGQSEQAQAAGEAAAVLQALMIGEQVQPAHFAASCAVLRAVGYEYEG